VRKVHPQRDPYPGFDLPDFRRGSALTATDTVSATAGLSPKMWTTGGGRRRGYAWDSSAFDNLFNKASEKYGENKNAGGANAKPGSRSARTGVLIYRP